MEIKTLFSKDYKFNSKYGLHYNVGIRLIPALLVRPFRSGNISKVTIDFGFLLWMFSLTIYFECKGDNTLRLINEEISGMTDSENNQAYDALQHFNDPTF